MPIANTTISITKASMSRLMQMQAREARARARVPRCGDLMEQLASAVDEGGARGGGSNRKKNQPLHQATGKMKPMMKPAVAKRNSLR